MINRTVPVALFVYNRADCLEQTLKSLKRNKIDKLFVYSDGPKDGDAIEGVTKVRKLIKNINWVDCSIVERKQNFGLSRSIRLGINEVLGLYDRVVVIEDDICVADGFYQYMKSCLDKYENSEEVAGVTGVRYPFDRKVFEDYLYDVFFTHRFSSWGWGTWRRWWQGIETDIEELRRQVKNTDIDWSQGGHSMKYMATARLVGETHGVWDIDCAINILIKGKFFVCPKYNLVRNTGFANGTHTDAKNQDIILEWEKSTNFNSETILFPKKIEINETINRAFIDCFPSRNPSPKQWLIWNKLRLERLVGINK